MDLEKNKIIAAVLLGGLIAMLSGTFSKIIYGSYDHTEAKRGYSVEVVEEGAATKEKEEININALIVNASVEGGEKVAKKCLACHSFTKGGANKVGPNLYGILGDSYARNKNFQYSKAFQALDGGWDYENLWAFLNKPSKYVPGTKMAFAGIKKPKQLADMIAYMRSLADNPYPLPKVETKEEANADTIEEVVAK